MLPTAARLRRGSELRAATRAGRRGASPPVVVHVRRHAAVDPAGGAVVPAGGAVAPRAGFVVARAVGGAVVRNRVRRRLRHLVAARLRSLPAGTDLVVRALAGADRLSSDELGARLDAALAAAAGHRRRRGRGVAP